MSDAYDKDIANLARQAAEEQGCVSYLRHGVYCMLAGPTFETIAECRALQILGADAVGKKMQKSRQFKWFSYLGASRVSTMPLVKGISGQLKQKQRLIILLGSFVKLMRAAAESGIDLAVVH